MFYQTATTNKWQEKGLQVAHSLIDRNGFISDENIPSRRNRPAFETLNLTANNLLDRWFCVRQQLAGLQEDIWRRERWKVLRHGQACFKDDRSKQELRSLRAELGRKEDPKEKIPSITSQMQMFLLGHCF